jgi:hypothetical protein
LIVVSASRPCARFWTFYNDRNKTSKSGYPEPKAYGATKENSTRRPRWKRPWSLLLATWLRRGATAPDIGTRLDQLGKPRLFYPRPGRKGERPAVIILPQILTAATILQETQIE